MMVSRTTPIHSASVANGAVRVAQAVRKMAAISSPYSARKDAG